MLGFVYFVEAPAVHRIKIGFASQDLSRRFSCLQTASPVPLVLIGYIKGPPDREWELHERFAVLREKGEWFRDEPPLRKFIKKHATKYVEDVRRKKQSKATGKREIYMDKNPDPHQQEVLSATAQKIREVHEAKMVEMMDAMFYGHARQRRRELGSKIQ